MLDEPFADMPEELAALVDTLRGRGIELIDKRHLGGCLWVVSTDGQTAQAVCSLADKKYKFGFSQRGGKTTNGRAAWWIQERDLQERIREKRKAERTGLPIEDSPFYSRLQAMIEKGRAITEAAEPNLPLEDLQDSEEIEHPETDVQSQQAETRCCRTCAFFKPKPGSFLGKCDYHGFPEISNDYCCGRWMQAATSNRKE